MDGKILVIPDFKTGVAAIVDETEKFFYARVLRGLRFPKFEEMLTKLLDYKNTEFHIHDNQRDMTMGYSFLTDIDNQFDEFEYALFEAFMDPANKSDDIDFHTINSDGTIAWKRAAVRSWFTDDGEMSKVELLFIPCDSR